MWNNATQAPARNEAVQVDAVAEASEESFPASDAPSWTTSTAIIGALQPQLGTAEIPSATGEFSPHIEASSALERGTGLAIGTR